MTKATIYIADDHAILRDGLRHIISSYPEYEIIGEAGDGRTALEEIEKLKPGIVILDISMPVMTGIEVARQLRKYLPDVKIIILSKDDTEEFIHQLLKYGINAYVTKDNAVEDLMAAIREVLKGNIYLSTQITKKIVSSYQTSVGGEARAGSNNSSHVLSNREKEVLKLLAEGRLSSEIASILRISTKTVDAHRCNIKKKLNVHNLPDLVKYAIKNGLIEL